MRAHLGPIATLLITALIATPLSVLAIPPPPQTESIIGPNGETIVPERPDTSSNLSVILPTMRTLFGAAWLTQPAGMSGPLSAGFAFDFNLGAIIARESGSGLVLWPELGYSYGGPSSRSRNLVTAGLGIHYGDAGFSWGWTPAFVAGSEGDATAYGMRNGLVARWYFLSAELSHTFTTLDHSGDHEFRFTVGIDVLWSIVAVLFTNALGSIRN